MVERLEKLAIGEAIHAKREAMFFHWMAPRDVCARLSSIVAIPEVELQCVLASLCAAFPEMYISVET